MSNGKDLYGQRHIAYFDPPFRFEHVEPIEQFEDEETVRRIPINDDRTINVSFRR